MKLSGIENAKKTPRGFSKFFGARHHSQYRSKFMVVFDCWGPNIIKLNFGIIKMFLTKTVQEKLEDRKTVRTVRIFNTSKLNTSRLVQYQKWFLLLFLNLILRREISFLPEWNTKWWKFSYTLFIYGIDEFNKNNFENESTARNAQQFWENWNFQKKKCWVFCVPIKNSWLPICWKFSQELLFPKISWLPICSKTSQDFFVFD